MAQNSSDVRAWKICLVPLEENLPPTTWKICFPLFQISFDLKNLSPQIIFENQKCTVLTTFLNDPFTIGYC